MISFNYKIKQLLILSLLIAMIFLAIRELHVFMPGLLGAVTLYILSRGSYHTLTVQRKWKKGLTAWLFLIAYFVLLVGLIYVTVVLLLPKIELFFNDPSFVVNKLFAALESLQQKWGLTLISKNSLSRMGEGLSLYIPRLLNNTVNLLGNIAILLFMFYYLLVNSKDIEQYLARIIPLKQYNIRLLAYETKSLIKASALGIPFISLVQGVTATVGYIIFGLDDYILWGFLTGVFAFFPIVGTMIIWVPLVISMYANGNTWHATGLMVYSLIVTGNIDYLARITILNKIGQVHPVVTVLGVIVGLGLFGFIGLIFGPLLISYVILLFKIYTNEYIDNKEHS